MKNISAMVGQLGQGPNNWYQSQSIPSRGMYEGSQCYNRVLEAPGLQSHDVYGRSSTSQGSPHELQPWQGYGEHGGSCSRQEASPEPPPSPPFSRIYGPWQGVPPEPPPSRSLEDHRSATKEERMMDLEGAKRAVGRERKMGSERQAEPNWTKLTSSMRVLHLASFLRAWSRRIRRIRRRWSRSTAWLHCSIVASS